MIPAPNDERAQIVARIQQIESQNAYVQRALAEATYRPLALYEVDRHMQRGRRTLVALAGGFLLGFVLGFGACRNCAGHSTATIVQVAR